MFLLFSLGYLERKQNQEEDFDEEEEPEEEK